MDWQNVTLGEVFHSLREVDWSQPPKTPAEFLRKFSQPASKDKLATRLKCNLYNFRTNYILILLACLLLAFIRRPWALLAQLLVLAGCLCLNDTFAASVSNATVKWVRRVSPPLAQRIRAASAGSSGLGAPGRSKPDVKILGTPRGLVVAGLLSWGLFLFSRTSSVITLVTYSCLGAAIVLLHASFRTPNLKTRLASAREEFRAVWRGYQTDYGMHHDYTV